MYNAILADFAYDTTRTTRAARMLDRMLNEAGIPDAYPALRRLIEGNTVLVAGSGPSLDESFDTLARHAGSAVLIAADTAAKPLVDSRHHAARHCNRPGRRRRVPRGGLQAGPS